MCVCVCGIKELKRVLLTSIEYKFSLYRLSFYFSFCWGDLRHGITVHVIMVEQATSLLRSFYLQWTGLQCARSVQTFRPVVLCCGLTRTWTVPYGTGCSELIGANLLSSLFSIQCRRWFSRVPIFGSSVSSEPEFCFLVFFYIDAELSISCCVCDTLVFHVFLYFFCVQISCQYHKSRWPWNICSLLKWARPFYVISVSVSRFKQQTAWTLKLRSLGFCETSVINYHSTLGKIAKERTSLENKYFFTM
jgi:hypothetical protein